MRHAFADPYLTDLGERRVRCSRCGTASHWPGATDLCSGKHTPPEEPQPRGPTGARGRPLSPKTGRPITWRGLADQIGIPVSTLRRRWADGTPLDAPIVRGHAATLRPARRMNQTKETT